MPRLERRKKSASKSSPLPVDYAKLVQGVFTTTFDAGLKALAKLTGTKARFAIDGAILADEIVLTVSLLQEGKISGTTIYASTDFDPKASIPNAQDLLGACVDAMAALFAQLLDPKSEESLEAVSHESLSALEGVPHDWTLIEVERYKVYLKVDKANIELEAAADEWLAKNDPKYQEMLAEEEEAVKELFVTGVKKPGEPTKH
jgi:hypothetical protein